MDHKYPGRALLSLTSQRDVPWAYCAAVRGAYEHVFLRQSGTVATQQAIFEAMNEADRHRVYFESVSTLGAAIDKPVECLLCGCGVESPELTSSGVLPK